MLVFSPAGPAPGHAERRRSCASPTALTLDPSGAVLVYDDKARADPEVQMKRLVAAPCRCRAPLVLAAVAAPAGAAGAAAPPPGGRRAARDAGRAGAAGAGHRRVRRAPAEPLHRAASTRSSRRLESLRAPGAAAAARRARSWPRPTSCAAARTTTSASRRRRRTASARWCSSSPQYTHQQGAGLAEDRRLLQLGEEGAGGLPGRVHQARRARASRSTASSWPSPTSSRWRCWPASTRWRSRARATRPRRARSASRPRPPRRCEVELVRTLASAVLRHGAGRASRSGWTASCAPPPAASWRRTTPEAARAQGLDPARASARIEIAQPLAGLARRRAAQQVLRDRARARWSCRSRRTTTPTRCSSRSRWRSLQLRSDPPGGRIFLDGEAMGVTPKDLDARLLRQAPHRGEARRGQVHPGPRAGARTRRSRLDCPIRPSLAFLGVVAESAAGERVLAEAEEKLVAEPGQDRRRLNFIPAPRETVDRILELEQLTRSGLSPARGPTPDVHPQGHREAGGRAGGAGLPGRACCRRRSCSARRCCTCWPRATRSPTAGASPSASPASYLRFLAAVDRQGDALPALERPHHRGHAAARGRARAARGAGQPGRPGRRPAGRGAGRRGRQAGEADRGPAGRGRGAASRRTSWPCSSRGGAGAAHAWSSTLAETPQEIPLNDPVAPLQQGDDGPAPAGGGLSGHRAGRLRAAEPRALRDALRRLRRRPRAPAEGARRAAAAARASPRAPRSTTWAWRWSGSATRRRRRDAYRAAAASKDATLFNNDGPAVSRPGRAAARAVSAPPPPARLVWERPDGARVDFPLAAAAHGGGPRRGRGHPRGRAARLARPRAHRAARRAPTSCSTWAPRTSRA